jgi:predicted O-linked N-acetylglucosamine transferase (SPINDLY family)
MTRYNAYSLDRNKQIVKLTVLECASDEEAGRQARALAGENAIELWRDERKLWRFDPRAPKRQPKSARADRARALEAQMQQALALHRADRLAEAAKAYGKILRVDRDNPQALTLLGTVHAQQGNYQSALGFLNRSLDLDARQPFALNSLGNALNAMDRHGEALAAFDKSIALQPDQASTYSNGGNALRALKRHKEALAAYRKAITVDPNYAEAYSNRGDLLRELRRYEDALTSYDKALSLCSDSVRDLFGKAVALQALDRPQEALEYYDRVVALKPDFSDAWNNRGNALAKLQRHESALECYETAVKLNQGFAAAYNNWGSALRWLRRFDEALTRYGQAIACDPNYANAHSNLGLALQDLGRHTQALASLDKAIDLDPGNADCHRNRGNVMRDLKRYDEAIASFDCAIGLRPNFADAYLQRGGALQQRGDLETALASYDKAIALKPDLAEAHNGRGSVLAKLQRYEEALRSYDNAVRIKPDYALAYSNRGNAWKALNRYSEALASYDKAIALTPDYAPAHHNRGIMLRELRRFDAALASYDTAIGLNPDSAGVHLSKSIALRELRRFEEARDSVNKAIELDPTLPYALGQRMIVKQHICDWSEWEASNAAVVDAIERGERASVPFGIFAVDCRPEIQRKCTESYVRDKHPPQALRNDEAADQPVPSAADRIRIAYLSADFHSHATAYLLAGVLEQHDRAKFEISAVSFGRSDGGEMRARLEKACEHFLDVGQMTDHEVAALLRARKTDIVVDLKGFTKEARTRILALRPAPIQVNYLGYPGTMGAPYIDYLIADKIVIPEQDRSSYAESVVYLPDSYQCNDSRRAIADTTPSRSDLGLPETGFVFCSFNNAYKITPEIFDVWMRILARTKGSVLWLLETNPVAARNLRKEAEARGIARERLVFAPWCASQADHLARLRQADLFLDTLPCGAHTTASDALWAGVPVLTCIGRTFAGRVAASLLHAIGLPQMATSSMKEYEAWAIALSENPAGLAGIKAKLIRNRSICPLFDTVRSTRHLEAAYSEMVNRLRKGEAPAGFEVKPVEEGVCG